MIVGDEIKRFALVLQVDGRLHRAEEIPDVKFSAGLEAGENAHGAEHGFAERNRSSGDPHLGSEKNLPQKGGKSAQNPDGTSYHKNPFFASSWTSLRPQTSENNASIISTHFTPGSTSGSI